MNHHPSLLQYVVRRLADGSEEVIAGPFNARAKGYREAEEALAAAQADGVSDAKIRAEFGGDPLQVGQVISPT